MASRFEELVAWQQARELTRAVYLATQSGALVRDFGLRDQMQRSAVSIMANIAEGFERFRDAEFHQFLSIAKASCGELRSHLYVCLDVGYIGKEHFDELQARAAGVNRLIGKLRASIERKIDGKFVSKRSSISANRQHPALSTQHSGDADD